MDVAGMVGETWILSANINCATIALMIEHTYSGLRQWMFSHSYN
jgi:hypothetical protein